MLTKRIIPCLDVKEGKVVKGVRFLNHEIVGDIVELAQAYSNAGADELVFYDITASSDQRAVSTEWVRDVARVINIPFCVAGGIRNRQQAEAVLNAGADKVSLNSPAIENPNLINELEKAFGQQCVVVGIDSFEENGTYHVYQYTGDVDKKRETQRQTADWIQEVQDRGAGEIVLNCMNQDGVRKGYDLVQLKQMREITQVPLIASGGAGEPVHFSQVFKQANVDGALAASVFHKGIIAISALKNYLQTEKIEVRPC